MCSQPRPLSGKSNSPPPTNTGSPQAADVPHWLWQGHPDHCHPNCRPDKVVTTGGAQRQPLPWLSSSLTHLFCHFLPLDFSRRGQCSFYGNDWKACDKTSQARENKPQPTFKSNRWLCSKIQKSIQPGRVRKGRKKTHLNKRISFGEGGRAEEAEGDDGVSVCTFSLLLSNTN